MQMGVLLEEGTKNQYFACANIVLSLMMGGGQRDEIKFDCRVHI